MYKIIFISRNPCFLEQNLFPKAEIHDFGNTEKFDIFEKLLQKTLSSPPDLLLIHPPSGFEVKNVIKFLNQENNFPSSTKTLFFTSNPSDITLRLKALNDESFQFPEALLKLIWKPLIQCLVEYGDDISFFDSILSSIENSIEGSSNQSTLKDESSVIDHHAMRNRYGPGEVLRLAKINKRYLNNSTGNLSKLLMGKRKETKILKDEPEVPLELLKNIGPGITPPAKRVLLVDDEHSRGWSTVLGALVFGRTDERVYKITPEKLENSEIRFQVAHWDGNTDILDATVQSASELKGEIYGLFALSNIGDDGKYLKQFLNRKHINTNQRDLIPFDIILLDYRICDEGREVNLEDVSGYKMSSFIHQEDPSMPIIIVSASDKIWTLLTLQSVGAWDYYLKPNKFLPFDTRKNSYSEVDLGKFMNRLEQASLFSSWARTILIFAEFFYSIQKEINEKAFNWKDFSLSDNPSKRQKEKKGWLDKICTISDTFGYVAENLNEFSRLGLSQKSNEVVEERAIKLNRYLLAIATDSIRVINEEANGTLTSGLISYFNFISKAYRNVISHSTSPKCIPDHIHLLIQVISVVGLLPESITKKILIPKTDVLDWPLIEIDKSNEKFFLLIESNQNNDDCFPIRCSKKENWTDCWFSKLDDSPEVKLKEICKITKDFEKTTWISFVAPMLMILNQKKHMNSNCSDTNIESFNQLVYHLYGYAVNALIEKNIER